jgi:3-hydroxybutyrate dehydrogenase
MSRFDGKVSLVTGAASGIGKEIALRFAAEGGIPVIADLDLVAAEATVKEIKSKGSDAFAVAMNVVDEAAVEKGVADTMAKFGRIDILVSNAGIQIVRPIADLPFADWKKLLSIHLDGAFLTTKACLRHMYAANSGSVIYMGSVHSKEASVLKAPYVTAKHGLIGLCKVVAKEGAEHNIRANVVCPGFVRTPLVDKQIPEQAKELGVSEQDVIKHVMLKETVDGEFTTTDGRRRGPVLRRRAQQRADRAVDCGEPWLVHAVANLRERRPPGAHMYIDAAILSPVSALLGALIGGGASVCAAVYTQRYQNRLQRISGEISKRETVYADFVMNASNLLLNAYVHDDIALGGEEQRLIGLINRMRLFASPDVVKGAEAVVKAIVEISLKPSIEIRRLAKEALSESLDPDALLSFSLICRADLDNVLRTAV